MVGGPKGASFAAAAVRNARTNGGNGLEADIHRTTVGRLVWVVSGTTAIGHTVQKAAGRLSAHCCRLQMDWAGGKRSFCGRCHATRFRRIVVVQGRTASRPEDNGLLGQS